MLRVEPLLELRKPINASSPHVFAILLVDVEAPGAARIIICKSKFLRLVDAIAANELAELYLRHLTCPCCFVRAQPSTPSSRSAPRITRRKRLGQNKTNAANAGRYPKKKIDCCQEA